MLRTIAILLLLSAGLLRLNAGLDAGQTHCDETACHVPVLETSCCGGLIPVAESHAGCGSDAFCPMSNGPCQCGISPTPERLPDAPHSRTDRDKVTRMPNGPPQVLPVDKPDSDSVRIASLVLALTAGKSHNEVQALLGIWRT